MAFFLLKIGLKKLLISVSQSQLCFFKKTKKKYSQDKLLGTTREHALKAVAKRPVCQTCITTTASEFKLILLNNSHTRFHLYQQGTEAQ